MFIFIMIVVIMVDGGVVLFTQNNIKKKKFKKKVSNCNRYLSVCMTMCGFGLILFLRFILVFVVLFLCSCRLKLKKSFHNACAQHADFKSSLATFFFIFFFVCFLSCLLCIIISFYYNLLTVPIR